MSGFLYNNEIVQKDMEEIISDAGINFDSLKGKTVLVSGANGMLAYYCVCTLMYLNEKKDAKIKVIATVRNEQKALKKLGVFLENENFRLVVQDICEPINLAENAVGTSAENVVRTSGENLAENAAESVDYIIHAAGSSSPHYIKTQPLSIINANVSGTINICEFARKNGVKNILFTSTREIYGKVDNVSFIKEDDMGQLDSLDSRSCYPESKRMAEQILKSYGQQYDLPFTIVRIAHSYGPGMETENDGRVMSDFMSDVLHNRDIVLKSAGTAQRAFCYITDAVRGMFYALLNGKCGEAYNLANETEPMQIRDVAGLMTQTFPEKNIQVRFEIENDNGGYCKYKRVGLDTKKLEALGWKPEVMLKDGIKRTVESMQE